MSNNLASQQLSMPSNQMGQLEPITNNLDSSIQMGLMGSETTGSLQQMSVSNMQVVPVRSRYTGSASQQMSVSNMQMGMLHPMSNNFGSQMLPITNQQTGQMEPHTYNLLSQQFFLPSKQLGELGTMSNNVALQQLSSFNKRKATMEPMSNYSVPQQSSISNKRVAQEEHRPWLQQTSATDRAVQMQFMSSSPVSQHLPLPNKKVVKKEYVPSKPGPLKQYLPKIQNAHMHPSHKGQTESFESVRSKMRESLEAALALVSQELDNPSNAEKNSQNEPASSLGKIQENSQPAGSEFNASDALEPQSGESKGPPKENSPVPMCLDGQSAANESFANGNTTDNTQTSKCDEQTFRYSNLLPDEDVTFSDNFFARDDLLQGNGLSWVLEPVITVEEKKEVPTAVGQELGNGKVGGGRDGRGQPLEQSPEMVAFKIEAELFKLFGGVNKKYKEKGRSLLFNLKDRSNPELRERVMSGEISPERLCNMTAEELASKELSEWRMAKAEEFAQMVFLPDSDVDIRRLVKKTHKGEFQVEVEQVDPASADVSVGATSLVRASSKVNEKDAPPQSNVDGMKDEPKTAAADMKSNIKDEESPCTITIPSIEGSDLMQGLMVDNELKDAEFLPPIVSLDEFMESLNSEPPFENLPVDADKSTPVSDKDDSLSGSESKSPVRSALGPDTSSPKPDKVDGTNTKLDADMKPVNSPVKSETAPSAIASMSELVWDGQLQLNISSTVPIIGLYKSGERTPAKEWANILEIKGRVRLDAFEKFLQELPMSRSRAVMILHFVAKEASPQSQLESISEVAESYVSDGRVGFAAPGPGFELYICPPHKRTIDMLGKILPIGQLEALNAIDNGLIGVVVWRKAHLTSTISPNSASHHHKHSSKKQPHFSSRRQYRDKDSNMNVNVNRTTSKSAVSSHGRTPVFAKQPTPVEEVDDDDDVPPGFGPGAGQDDDDLPEFNFSGGSAQNNPPRGPRMAPLLHSLPQTPSRPVDQIRELIYKYGQPQNQPQVPTSSDKRGVGVAMQPWNDDDEEDDIPEWQPQAPPQHQPSQHPAHGFQRPHSNMVITQQQQIGLMQSHQQFSPTVMQGQGQQNAANTWAQGQGTHWVTPPGAQPPVCQPSGVQFYGQQPGVAWPQDAPKSRGF